MTSKSDLYEILEIVLERLPADTDLPLFTEEERLRLEDNKRRIQRSFPRLCVLLDELDQNKQDEIYKAVTNLVMSSSEILAGTIVTAPVKRHIEGLWASKARLAKQGLNSSRQALLRQAILDETPNINLVDSVKFAESIRGAICQHLSVDQSHTWPSVSVIRRAVRFILKERTNK